MRYKINILGIIEKANFKSEKFGAFASFLSSFTESPDSRQIVLDARWVKEIEE